MSSSPTETSSLHNYAYAAASGFMYFIAALSVVMWAYIGYEHIQSSVKDHTVVRIFDRHADAMYFGKCAVIEGTRFIACATLDNWPQ